MGQCKSKGKDFKSYANADALSASLSTDFKKAKESTWDSASLRAKILREIKENMGQSKSKERDFEE
jgi:hypothetical protein